MSTKQVTCRYFLHGVCREGNRCMFSHDLTTSKPSTICKFYQRGVCAYGDRCRYDHIKPSGGGGGGGGRGVPMDLPNRNPITAGAFIPPGVPGPLAPTAPQARHQGGKKPLVLRDRALGCDSTMMPFGGGGSEADCWTEYHDNSAHAKPPHSYLDAIRTGLECSATAGPYHVAGPQPQLCPYAAAGQCNYGNTCPYLHGDMCDICRLQVLHPHNPEQRRAHEKMCMLVFEADMEKAFAAQHSQDKVCSICMEVVYEKAAASERRFGILSSCCHTYCLSCIRQWRCAKQFENKIIKSCPECRVVSEFVIPSGFWVEDQDEKNRLIEDFKSGVSKKACKYFDQGRGTCPFGGKCFYMHAYPDGTRAEPDKPRKQLGSEGNVRFLNSVRLWDFIEEREQRSVAQPQEDEVSELRELFMQMSGPGGEESSAVSAQP
ncbi:probable E3 ubiquitin-protein ligase makorin-2 isoform X1 [Oncorhynchus mykiss]|uniref:probable E3 ubiquitin-protein ligase makorin-2 isoform X1 n=1 Tax=Oncorhynchus mykiss TaxID=8022 RepID=UPI001878D039|nr:probable E3 ubiquitin-protein ligase makorin-2 isoform X1 [Oncorhynchus mykiss]